MDYKKDQAKFREMSKPKFYPKGMEVPVAPGQGHIGNDIGQHIVWVGNKMQKVNRSMARRKLHDPGPTKPNYVYQTKKNDFKHFVNPPGTKIARKEEDKK